MFGKMYLFVPVIPVRAPGGCIVPASVEVSVEAFPSSVAEPPVRALSGFGIIFTACCPVMLDRLESRQGDRQLTVHSGKKEYVGVRSPIRLLGYHFSSTQTS